MVEFTHVVILVTTPTSDEAELIARVLLKERKAACASIIPGVSSHFWWEDKISSSQESLLVIKTKASLLDEIIRVIKEFHSYEVPEIIALPIIGGNHDYLAWIDKEVEYEKAE